MGTLVKTKEGTWRAQVRRKGKYASSTFRVKSLADEWVIETERLIDLGGEPSKNESRKAKTIGDLIDLHIADLQEVRKPLRRSKRAVLTGGKGRCFPYNSKSVGTAFRRGRNAIGADDLRFHDLRHEATSRLFEAGLPIERVALVTGHKDWKMLRRYTNLKPEDLHKLRQEPQPDEETIIRNLTQM